MADMEYGCWESFSVFSLLQIFVDTHKNNKH